MKLNYYFIPGFFALSMAAQAATITQLNDYNINDFLTIKNQSLASGDYEFKFSKKIQLSNGLIKNKYTLHYKNVPVFNTILSSSELDGKQTNWFGKMMLDIQDDITDVNPHFDQTAILKIAKDEFKPKKHDVIKNEQATLMIRMNEADKAELIYMVSFNVEGVKEQRPHFIIDAHNGNVLHSWDGLTTRSAEGPGGNAKVGAYYYGRDYGLLNVSNACEMTNNIVETYDMRQQTVGGVIYKFACPTNPNDRPVSNGKAINGAYSPLNDGHYFASMVEEMYRTWYNIDPLGKKLLVRVHFGNSYEGAFWNGTYMTFGDGGTNMYPLVALDIMAHEVSHGVTEKNSGLIYERQSGGINEAFSDMAGETAEAYMNQANGKGNDWMGGASVMKNVPAMRYFKNPTLDGVSIDHASKYNDSMDVHFSSGVYNKAFYLLATKPSWDIRKAFSVFLAANQVYWEPASTFNSAACGVAKAATDLGYEIGDVIASFKEVGVDANCNMPNPDTGKEIQLSNGTVVSNIKATPGSENLYFIKVPGLSTFPYTYDILSIRVFNAANTAKKNVDLWVRYEDGTLKKATPSAQFGTDELFNVRNPAAGNYHILIKGKNADNVSLNAVYGNFR